MTTVSNVYSENQSCCVVVRATVTGGQSLPVDLPGRNSIPSNTDIYNRETGGGVNGRTARLDKKRVRERKARYNYNTAMREQY